MKKIADSIVEISEIAKKKRTKTSEELYKTMQTRCVKNEDLSEMEQKIHAAITEWQKKSFKSNKNKYEWLALRIKKIVDGILATYK